MIAGALEAVAEEGIAGSSASSIAARSGLSWGVVQYHFGDRLGLFVAAFEDAIETFAEHQRQLGTEVQGSPAERIDVLVSSTWALMTSSSYRSLLEIQLLLQREPTVARRYRAGTERASEAAHRCWREACTGTDAWVVDRVQELVIAALRGLALSHALGTPATASTGTRRDLVAMAIAMIEGHP
jgi:AcrR family transcriptional regulator